MTDEQALEAASRIIADVQLSRPTYGTTAYQEDALAVAAAVVAQEARARKLEEALERIAESRDAGRHDGLPEECPAHDQYTMWLDARAALAEGRGK